MVKLSRCARHYQAKKTDDNLLATQLRSLAFHPSRWGYDKLTDYLKHQACTSKHKRIYRISRVLGLSILPEIAQARADAGTAATGEANPGC